MSDVVDALDKHQLFQETHFLSSGEKETTWGKAIRKQIGKFREPLGDSGYRRPYPGIPFFIFVSFPHAAYSSTRDMKAAGSIETSAPMYQTTYGRPLKRNLIIQLKMNRLSHVHFIF
jgi:hypothetical protein